MPMRCGLHAALICVLALTAAQVANAQSDGTGVDSQLVWTSPGPSSFPTVVSADVVPHKGVTFGAMLDYYRKPLGLEITDSTGETETEWVVSHALTVDFAWAFGILDIFQLGVVLPVVIDQDGAGATPFMPLGVDDGTYKLSGAAVKDMRFDLKTRFMGKSEDPATRGFGLALDVAMSIPTGDELNFAGEEGFVFQPLIVADYRSSIISTALNLGARLRTEKAALADLEVGHQALAGLGVTGHLWEGRVLLFAEATMLAEMDGFDRIGLEYRGGAGVIADDQKAVTVWIGAGSSAGTEDLLGTPIFRMLLGITYAPGDEEEFFEM